MFKLKRSKKPLGFTLIEILIIISISGILTSLAIPALKTMMANSLSKDLMVEVSAALNAAKSSAVSQNTSVQVCGLKSDGIASDPSATNWQYGFQVSNASTNARFQVFKPKNSSGISVNPGACPTFNAKGLLVGGTPFSIQIAPTGSTMPYCITVSWQGQITKTQSSTCAAPSGTPVSGTSVTPYVAPYVAPSSTPSCPGGQTWSGTSCVCPSGSNWNGSSCITCSGGQSWNGSQCVCPSGSNWNGSSCITCSSGQIWNGSQCVCPSGSNWNGSYCVTCSGGQYWDGSSCVCSSGTYWNGSSCIAPAPAPTPVPVPAPAPTPTPTPAPSGCVSPYVFQVGHGCVYSFQSDITPQDGQDPNALCTQACPAAPTSVTGQAIRDPQGNLVTPLYCSCAYFY